MATYFKNTELAARYNISEATVRNWIKSTKQGRLRLELVTRGSHTYVANSVSNIPLIGDLVEQNRKYRNSLSARTVKPSRELFRVFDESQVYDIVRNLELHHEIPLQYSYFGRGAVEWESYIRKQTTIDAPSMFRRTLELLADSYGYLDRRLASFKRVNVIDIGVGNAMPVRELVGRLIAQGKLGRYVGLDFSKDMLTMAERNLKSWFGSDFPFEGYQIDIAHQRFAEIIARDYLSPEDNTMNLVLFLGATPNNLRVRSDAFRTICESMNPRDLLIYTDKLEPAGALPEWFEYEAKRHGKSEVMQLLRMVYDLFNIEDSFYDIEIGFDDKISQRYARTRFKVAVKIVFEFDKGRRVLSLEKGDAITLWRCWQTTTRSLMELHEDNGFDILHSTQSEDHNYALVIAEPQRS